MCSGQKDHVEMIETGSPTWSIKSEGYERAGYGLAGR